MNGNGLVSCDQSYYPRENNHDYENLVMKPVRPAPDVPVLANQSSSSLNSNCQGRKFFFTFCRTNNIFLLRIIISFFLLKEFNMKDFIMFTALQGVPFILNTRLEATSKVLLVSSCICVSYILIRYLILKLAKYQKAIEIVENCLFPCGSVSLCA